MLVYNEKAERISNSRFLSRSCVFLQDISYPLDLIFKGLDFNIKNGQKQREESVAKLNFV